LGSWFLSGKFALTEFASTKFFVSLNVTRPVGWMSWNYKHFRLLSKFGLVTPNSKC